jgi:hypothetical protein
LIKKIKKKLDLTKTKKTKAIRVILKTIEKIVENRKKNWRMKQKKNYKNKQVSSDKPSKPGLISQTHNPLSSTSGFNQETQYFTILMSNDEIAKKIIKQKNSR